MKKILTSFMLMLLPAFMFASEADLTLPNFSDVSFFNGALSAKA